jgi:23S rRNA (uracil1939-C5)-methyltransferase
VALKPRPGGGADPAAERVAVVSIAAGGAGVARLADGRVVFVQRTAPGDTALVALEEERPRWVRGRLLEVLEPSPDRRVAPCRHYARCGGCTLEHLRYDAQLAAKAAIVHEALHRIGGRDLAAPEVVPSPREFHYRNRVSFTLVRLPGGRVVAGFHELDRPGRVMDIGADCMLPEEAVAEAWRGLRREWGTGAARLPAGRRLRLTLRASESGRASLLVEGGFGEGRPAELIERVPGLVSVWHRPRHAARVARLAGPSLEEAWQDDRLEVGGAVFLQVNRGAAVLLEEHVMALAGAVAGQHVIDAYCGVGLHARRLALAGARATGIELDPHAVAEAERRAPAGVRFLTGPVEDRLAEALPADLVILNPPRAGVAAPALAALVAQPPHRIIYVSCDAATLARDLQRLGETFHVTSLRAFDLFPQTAHVETVVELSCATM